MKAARVLFMLFVLVTFGVQGENANAQQAMALVTAPDLAPATLPQTLNLDGAGDYVLASNHPDLNPSGGITIEAWVLRADSSRCETVVGKNHITGYWLGFCSQRIRFYTSGSGSSRDGVHTVPTDEWTHIAVTFDGVTRRYYINGMLDYESARPASLPSNTDDLGIGANPDGSFPFQGSLAEVRIWSIARSQPDIRRDMMRQIYAARPGLIAVWRLVGNARDELGRHDGALMGDATFTGPTAPPVGHDPILIPRLLTPPNVNGVCLPNEYGNLRLPIWYGDDWAVNNLAWVYVGATGTDIYVCMDRLQWGSFPNQFTSVYLDPDNDAGPLAQPSDYRINIEWPSRVSGSQRGNGVGGYVTPGLSNYAVSAEGPGLAWAAEYRIGRDVLPTRYSTFRMQFAHQWLTAISDDYGWPVDFEWNRPEVWERFRINDTEIPADFDVQVQAVEVTQGIRTNIPTRVPPNGDTVLVPDGTFQTHVANRRTIVRVYPWVQVNSGGVAPRLSAELYGYDDSGSELPGSPLSPQNLSLRPTTILSLNELREEAARSWNFVLPESWTAAGRIRLDAVANPPGPYFARECAGCDSNNRVMLSGVYFYTVSPVTLYPTLLRWPNVADDGSVTWVTPNLFQIANAFAYMNKTWPVADLRLRRLHTATPTCITNLTDCRDPYSNGPFSPQARQRAERDRLGVQGGDPILFPALYNPASITLQSNASGRVFLARIGCGGNAGVPAPDYWGGACGPTLAHESAHAGPARNHAGGVHGSIGAVDPAYPDPHGGIEPNAYGFDIFAMQAIPPVGRITHTHDYMSYGRNELVWTSRYTWDGIRTWLSSVAAAEAQAAPANARETRQATTAYLQLSGQIVANGGSTINPAFQVELAAGAGDEEGQGSYELALFDEAGKTLFLRRFEPIVWHSHWSDDGAETIYFAESAPLKPGLARVVLSHKGQVLASRSASPGAPTINLLTPAANDKWGASGVTTVSWNVANDGGDPLSFQVEGSQDGGATWTLFGGSEGGTEAKIDLTDLPGAGPDWTIRVQASDGLNIGLAEVNPVEIAAKAPRVLVMNPREGASATPSQEIALLGQAFDWLDGQLADSQLAWQVDGQTIGKGAQSSISSLTVGQHAITLQATNSSGLQSAMSVTITIATDADFDGLPDAWEKTYGFDPETPNASEDPDQDRLANWQELREGTNPLVADTDHDGFGDKEEVNAASDPLDANSTPYSGEVMVYLPMISH